MKKLRIVLMLTVLALLLAAPARAQINGEMQDVGGFPVLHVWGTAYEMGFAQGYLLGAQMKEIVQKYILSEMPVIAWDAARMYYPILFSEPPRIDDEFAGFVDGALASGADIYLDELGRNMDALDMKVANAFSDLSSAAYLCSSFSAFGDATVDSELGGALAFARNLDWGGGGTPETQYILSAKTLLVVRTPDDPDFLPTVSITYPGFLGCLSCLNGQGVGGFLNRGNHHPLAWKFMADGPFEPVGYAIRDGVESRDLTGDGVSSSADVVEALHDRVFGSALVHVVDPQNADDPALVVELQTLAGRAVRRPAEDPQIGPARLALTNHDRKLFPPVDCWRYDIMIQQTQARDGKFDLPSLWDLMKQVAFYDLGGFTNYTILYRTDTMQFGLAKSDETGFSVDKQPVWFDLADLLSYTPPDDDAASDDDAADDDAAPPHADNGDDNSGCGC